ncbi:hypothetical protein Ahia01_000859200 [Argonauta hians]
MIIYKGSDVKTLYISTDHSSLHPFCDYQPSVIPPEVEFENHQRNNIYKEPLYNQSIHSNETWNQSNCKHDRRRRDVLPKDNCEVMLIADYIYFQNIGNSSVLKTINYMMQVMTRVDSIFRSTVWDEDEDGELKGFGVKVKEIRIHTAYSFRYQYNVNKTFKASELLQELKENSEDNNFCLVHLFTYRRFKSGAVGIAFTKNLSEPSGGICSASDPYPGVNAGLSSSLNMFGRQLLFPQALLVTTHGHNWGAGHDPNEGDCSPSVADGGKYVMYPYSVHGIHPNNYKFSRCSKLMIKEVLLALSQLCFKDSTEDAILCGNGKLDDGEDCDDGFFSTLIMTKCCTEKCYFTKGSECSPVHQGCCTDSCKIAPKGERCYSVTGDSEGCVLSATCNGVDFDCPQTKPLEDDTSCGDRGRCKNGTCIPFCEYRNLTSCICESMHETCYICCSSEGHECNPYDGIIKYSDGRPCLQGYCQNGVCVKPTTDHREGTTIHTNNEPPPNQKGGFRKANVVLILILLSVFLWIPCCFFNCRSFILCLTSLFDAGQHEQHKTPIQH